MKASLEQIAAALFARTATIPGLITRDRQLRPWSEVPSSEQPALFQASEDADAPAPGGAGGGRVGAGLTAWTLRFTWYVYVHRAALAGGVLLDAALNDLVDACAAALAPGPGSASQTLGGLVADCRIAGTIGRDGGVLGDQGVAIVPIEVRRFPQ